MNQLSTIWQGLDWSILTDALFAVIPILLCLTIHELAHGVAAYALGDNTAKDRGRLSLNPLRHIDPIGFLMLLFVRFGWAKPVPVDMRNFKRPKFGMAITALAGPLSNFLLAAVIFLFQVPLDRLFRSGGVGFYVSEILLITAIISVNLGIFNLIPIPPLDGSKILFSVLPESKYYWLMRYERYGMIALMALLFFGFQTAFLPQLMQSVVNGIWNLTRGLSLLLFS